MVDPCTFPFPLGLSLCVGLGTSDCPMASPGMLLCAPAAPLAPLIEEMGLSLEEVGLATGLVGIKYGLPSEKFDTFGAKQLALTPTALGA